MKHFSLKRQLIPFLIPYIFMVGMCLFYLYVHVDVQVIQITFPAVLIIGGLIAYLWVLGDRVVQAQENLRDFNKRFSPR